MSDQHITSLAELNWAELHQMLDKQGYAKLPPLLNADSCACLIKGYEDESLYRKTIDMTRYRFGIGEYKYYHNPLPDRLQQIRDNFYPELAKAANRQRNEDYTGGEFLLIEQRPRAQSRGHVITLNQGEGLIFPTQYRPVLGTRGYYRLTLRHGVGTVNSGMRYSLGVIFHDAK